MVDDLLYPLLAAYKPMIAEDAYVANLEAVVSNRDTPYKGQIW